MRTYEYRATNYNEYEDNDCLKDSDFVDDLQYYLERQGLKGALRLRRHDFSTTSYVGVIKYKDFQLDIFPKLLAPKTNGNEQQSAIDNEEDTFDDEQSALTKDEIKELENEEQTTKIIQNLLYMISITEKLDINITEHANISNCENPFLEVLIREYAISLFECLKRLTPRNYVREEDNLNYLKGKLKFTENIRYNCANQAKFYCEYDEFSENNELNRLFLFVSKCLFTISKSSDNRKTLSFIMNYFCDLPFERTDKYKAKKIILTRNQQLFEHPFKLAKMFLQKISVDISKNSIENITLLWDMNKLFEEFVYEVLNRGCNRYTPYSQKHKKLLLNADSKREKGNSFVDIYIENSDRKIVLDTKYKLDTLKDNADIYQLCTYCLLHGTPDSILIYPKNINCPSKFCDKPEGFEQNLGVVTLKGEHCGGSDDEATKCDTRLNKESEEFFILDEKEYKLNTDENVPEIFINRIYVDLSKDLKQIIDNVSEFEDILDKILEKRQNEQETKKFEKINKIKEILGKYEITKINNQETDNKKTTKEELQNELTNILTAKEE